MSKSMIYLIILISACVNSNSSDSQKVLLPEIGAMNKLEISILPFGGGDEGYSLVLKGLNLSTSIKSIEAKNDELSLGKEIKSSTKVLSQELVDEIEKSLNPIIAAENYDERKLFALDTWVYTINWNEVEILKFDSSEIKEQKPEVKRLIKTLIKESPIEIDLPHFS